MLLHPVQFDGIGIAGIPLADIHILLIINTNVMAVFKNRFLLNHQLQLALLIFRGSPSRVGSTRFSPFRMVTKPDSPVRFK
ncbi:hypothetical protein SAMN06265218_103243 [Fodinibius sediminis]|uniref:Uncharacterized protein n=1 Tax=Fodinibius sediminis TaxID=1214077 RepID=A0A521BPG5_9BACT|nr:hypothetical protein SAMN06265218_103243 [Fodinibius sediminis]